VQREVHFGQELWVHRKGALPAAESQPGVIPGSMGSRSYHVTGRGLPESLQSSSHGAGRAMARQQARQQVSRRHLQQQMRGVWFNQRQADSLRDEAPSAYKDIGRVMRAQRDLTRIVRELRPLLVYKGS
jgi:tRNA-splicing ligase RtcB